MAAIFKGELVYLAPLTSDLMQQLTDWDNDPDVRVPSAGQLLPTTLEAKRAWYDDLARSPDRSSVHFVIRRLDNPTAIGGQALGVATLYGISLLNRSATLSIFIGPKSQWGHGFGTEATRLICRYGFAHLGLHSIMLAVHADNERAIRTYLRVGFEVIGRQRQGTRTTDGYVGRYVDLLLMDLLETDALTPDAGGDATLVS